MRSSPDVEQKAALRAARLAMRSIYFVQHEDEFGPIKIGVAHEASKRVSNLQTGSPIRLIWIGHMFGADREVEKRLHRKFAHLHLRGEWFQPGKDLLALIAACNERLSRRMTLEEIDAFPVIVPADVVKRPDPPYQKVITGQKVRRLAWYTVDTAGNEIEVPPPSP
jgi:hypothetical protein